jgi:pimeloyl-ACP methyl ester carboxylesterase
MKLTLHGTTGPWVVKLSGIAGGVRLYDREIEAAVAAGFRVVALDTSGDRKDDPSPGPLTWELFASEVEAAIAGTGAVRAVLWGTSFGCLVALAAAARRPARVSGLLLCHPPDPRRPWGAHVALLRWAEARGHPDLLARVLFSTAFGAMTSWELACPLLWPQLPRLLAASIEAATPPSTVRQKLGLLFREDPGVPAPSTPVEIIAGGWDLVAPIAGCRALAARLPGARMTEIGFSGHAGAYTRPRAHNRAVAESLARLS